MPYKVFFRFRMKQMNKLSEISAGLPSGRLRVQTPAPATNSQRI